MRASDEQLLHRLQAGDRRAFDELYARYEQPLYGFVCAQLHDRAAAEDVVHEAFISVFRGRTPAGVTSFRAWLYQVARHACLNRARGRQREARAIGALSKESSEAASPAEPLEAAQRARLLEVAVNRLPLADAELYRLRARGLSYGELAEVFAVPLGTIKSRLHELVRRLKEHLS